MSNFTLQSYEYWGGECPIYNLYTIFGKKWLLIVLHLVKDDHYSYSIIKRKIPEISSKVLSERLQLLCDKGMVSKDNTGKYIITKKGILIINSLIEMGNNVMKLKGKK